VDFVDEVDVVDTRVQEAELSTLSKKCYLENHFQYSLIAT
jgi:hypothetical protein